MMENFNLDSKKKWNNYIAALKKSGDYQEVKILCKFCDLKDNCIARERKEEFEKMGWTTRCPVTPNKPKKNKLKKKNT